MTNEINIFSCLKKLVLTNGNFFEFLKIHIVYETERHEVG